MIARRCFLAGALLVAAAASSFPGGLSPLSAPRKESQLRGGGDGAPRFFAVTPGANYTGPESLVVLDASTAAVEGTQVIGETWNTPVPPRYAFPRA